MDLLYQIGLTLIPGIGDVTGKKLLSYCGGAEAVFKEKKSALLKIPGIGQSTLNSILKNSPFKRAEREILFIEKYKVTPLFYLDKNYPDRLKNCEDSPMMLYYKGNADLNKQKVLSIVGTRRISPYGKRVCKEITASFNKDDVLLISGLAYGVDTFAHKNAVKNSIENIAVLAHGLDRLYPPENKELASKIMKKGGLITEFLSGTKPDRENFPKRNRIIAGISDATLVVESARKGGAIITAEIANSYNKDVFAVPGRIHDIASEGCNYLIKTHKASIVQNGDDIKYFLGWNELQKKEKRTQPKLFPNLDEESKNVLKILQEEDAISVDKISLKCKLSISKVANILLNLEFEGLIECLPGKVYKLT